MVDNQSVTPETSSELNNTVKVGHLLLALLAVLGSIIGVYVNLEKTDSEYEVRLKTLETTYNKLDGKIDKLLDKTETLMIISANKQDRK